MKTESGFMPDPLRRACFVVSILMLAAADRVNFPWYVLCLPLFIYWASEALFYLAAAIVVIINRKKVHK